MSHAISSDEDTQRKRNGLRPPPAKPFPVLVGLLSLHWFMLSNWTVTRLVDTVMIVGCFFLGEGGLDFERSLLQTSLITYHRQ